jgi:Type I phosphodiesterase / nucleotide pyrophosphatase
MERSLRLLACLSLANLFFLDEWDRVATRWSDAALAAPPNPTLAQFFGALLIALSALTLLFYILATAAPRLWKWFVPIALLAPLNLFRINVLHLEHTTAIVFIAICAIATLWWREKALAIPLLLAPLLPIQLAYNFWRYEHLPPPSAYVDQPNAPLLPVKPNAPRVVWIIFDELDQSLVFDHRPASVQLPEFDRLRRESAYADHVEAPGLYTMEAIPGMLTGHHVDHARQLGPGDLLLQFATIDPSNQPDNEPRPQGAVQPRTPGTPRNTFPTSGRDRKGVRWSLTRNIFDDLRDAGSNSAILGAELPYCRAIGHSAASCDWFPSGTVDVALNRPSILHRPWYLLRTRPFTFPGLSSTRFYRAPLFDEATRRASRKAEAASFDRMRARAKELAADTRFQLVYMHFPIPHLLGFYDRRKQAYSTEDSASYLDNLALADRTLGEIRALLPDNTILLVTSDHPLRDWIIEDAGWWNDHETASLGPVPRRYVPYLLRGQNAKPGGGEPSDGSGIDIYDLLTVMFGGVMRAVPHI